MNSENAKAPEKKTNVVVIIAVIVGVLILSCACLSVGAALLAPALFAAREKANLAKCANNLKQQSIALLLYQADLRGFPEATSETGIEVYQKLIEKKYFDGPEACFCPAQAFRPAAGPGGEPAALTEENCGYIILRIKLPPNPPSNAPLAWCREPHPNDTRNIAFADGHVESMTEEKFQAFLVEATERFRSPARPK